MISVRLDERSVRDVRVNDFESAALPHLNSIYRTAVGLLGDRNEAQDLTQDVYLNAWKSFHRFELGTNCRAWLFKILFSRLHHHRRKWYRLRLAKEGEEGLEEMLVYEPPVPQRLTDEDVLAAMDKVPEVFREVLLLSDVEEFTYKEIAATLGIPVGTVMSRLNRARRSLRALMVSLAQGYGIGKAVDVGSRRQSG